MQRRKNLYWYLRIYSKVLNHPCQALFKLCDPASKQNQHTKNQKPRCKKKQNLNARNRNEKEKRIRREKELKSINLCFEFLFLNNTKQNSNKKKRYHSEIWNDFESEEQRREEKVLETNKKTVRQKTRKPWIAAVAETKQGNKEEQVRETGRRWWWLMIQ